MANKEELKLQQQLKKLLDESNLSASERLAIQADAARNTKQQLRDTIALLKEEQKITKELKSQEALNKKIADLEGKQIDIAKTLQSDLVKNKKEFEGIAKTSKDVGKNLIAAYKEQMKTLDLRTKAGRAAKEELDVLIKQTAEQNKIAKSLEAIASNDALAATFQEAQDLASSTASKIGGIFSKIPGGNSLFRALGGDNLESQLQKGVTSGLAAMAKSMAAGNSMVGSLKDGMGAFANVVKGIPNIGMILGIGAAIALAGALFSVFKNISHAAHELSEATGITYTQAKQLNKEARAAQSSFDNQLATMEDITAVQAELVKSMGSAALVSTEVAANVADTAKAFGVSAETAGKVTSELTAMGMSQQEAADLQLETNAMALKAGVNVAAVQEDIAANAASAAHYFGGSGKELAKAAVEAAKMGVSIEQMVKTADGLLDIESSLEKQFRAQALTGKNLNFEKARQLALDGKIEEAQKEMLRQAGTIDEFNAMAPHQRKALADAMGMEVGELQKSLQLQKMRGKLSEDELAAASGLNLSAEELANMSADQIKAELAKKNAADKTAAAFDSIKNDLVSALAPAAEAFADIFSALSPVIKGLGVALKIAFFPITLLGKTLKFIIGLMEKFKGITMVIGGLVATEFLLRKKKMIMAKAEGMLGKESLIRQKLSNALQTARDVLSGKINIKEKLSNTYAKIKAGLQNTELGKLASILATKVKTFVKEKASNALAKIRNGFGLKELATKKAIFVKDKASEALQKIKNSNIVQTIALKGKEKAIQVAMFLKEKAMQAITVAQNALLVTKNALMAAGNAIAGTGVGKILAQAGAFLMKAVSGIFATLSQIPFGAGLLLAGGAVAGLFALFAKAKAEKAGDVGISPNGGPIVASPKEGKIFQGTNNDGVEMSPTAGSTGGGGGGTTAQISSTQMKQIIETLQQIVQGVQNPPPVVIGEGQVNSIGSKISAAKSFIS